MIKCYKFPDGKRVRILKARKAAQPVPDSALRLILTQPGSAAPTRALRHYVPGRSFKA